MRDEPVRQSQSMNTSARTSRLSIAPVAPPQGQPDDDEIDLGALVATLWRGKWLIAFFTIVAILIGGYYAYVAAVPLYRSTAVVILETRQDQVVDLQSVVSGVSGDTSEINSEVEVLRARSLMGKVVDRLQLETDPEFNSKLRTPGLVDQAKATVIGSIKEAAGIEETVIELPPEEAELRTRDAVISALLDRITVQNIRQSLVFQITVETESAKKSALIADTIVDLYILNQIEVKFEATEQATIWLTNRVAELQQELETAQSKAADFSASTQLVSVEGLQALERQIKDQRDRIENVEQALFAARETLAELEAAESLNQKLAAANDVQLNRFAQRAETNTSIRQSFDTRFDQVVTRARLNVTRNEQQLAALRESSADLDAQLATQSQDLITLQQLTREADAIRLLYEYFLTRMQETSAQQGIQQADSRILSNAVVPNNPSFPRKSLILALSVILGLVLGAALVLLRELRNNSFRTAKDLESHTGYTVLGQIPLIPARQRAKVLNYLSEKPTSAAAEAIRNLRTSVMLSDVDNPPKVILSTSSVPGEGKTTNSLALAHNLLGLGKSVLLIEGDIRRRTMGQYFKNMPEKGLVSLLAGDIELEEALFKSQGLGADILAGEKTDTNAADLFASDKFKTFMSDMREKYDIIVIDTPPVLVVPDARIISQVADAVLFTVQWDKTSKAQVDEALRMFHNSNQRVSGLVLSQISPRGMKKYGYNDSYGAYSGYGARYYSN